MSEFTVKRATRQGVNPLIGLYGDSGSGKTYSALLLARGLAGPTGRIVMIDTESGRGSLYADILPGGYEVITMGEPFSPRRYIEALRAAGEGGTAAVIIDSVSHEWEALGGVQDMAMQSAKDRASRYNKDWDGTVQFGDWKAPKLEHAKMMIALLQSRFPVIVCLRAKRKSHQVRGTQEMAEAGIIENRQVGKTVVVKDEFTTPLQDENFIYEMTVHAEVQHDHTLRVTKCHVELAPIFQSGAVVGVKTGEALAKWCAGKSKPAAETDPRKPLVKRLWDMTAAVHGGDKAKLQQHLWDENLLALDPPETLGELSAERLAEVIAKIEAKGGKA
jgi:hypothetical protein